MQNDMQKGTRPTKENNEGEEGLPGVEEAVPSWSNCFTGGAVVEAGGGVIAHGRRLQAVVLLFQAAEKEALALPFSSVLLLFFFYVSFSFCPCLDVVFFSNPNLFRCQYRFSLTLTVHSHVPLIVPLGLFSLPFGSFSFFL